MSNSKKFLFILRIGRQLEFPAALAAEKFSIAVLSTAMEKNIFLCALCVSSEVPQGRDKRAVQSAYPSAKRSKEDPAEGNIYGVN